MVPNYDIALQKRGPQKEGTDRPNGKWNREIWPLASRLLTIRRIKPGQGGPREIYITGDSLAFGKLKTLEVIRHFRASRERL